MATIREATQNDIEGIAALFNSDPSYRDPWFDTPDKIAARKPELKSFSLESIDEFVVVDNGGIVGYVAAEEFYLTDERVAEIKKVFVRPDFRGKGIASWLLDTVEAEVLRAGYDFAVATTVCGHLNSQRLFLSNGYRITGFAPNLVNAPLTATGPRESALYLCKGVSFVGQAALELPRKVYVPPGAFRTLSEAYSAAGLAGLREIVVDDETRAVKDDVRWVNRFFVSSNPAMEATLPHVSNDIMRQDRVGRVRYELEAGGVAVGVLPVGTDRLIVSMVPRGLSYDPSKAAVLPQAQKLHDVVASAYNRQAARRH